MSLIQSYVSFANNLLHVHKDVIEMCRKGKQSDPLPQESRRAQCTIYKSHWAFVCKQKALDGTQARKERQHVTRNLLLIFKLQKTYAAERTSNHNATNLAANIKGQEWEVCQNVPLARNKAKPVVSVIVRNYWITLQ